MPIEDFVRYAITTISISSIFYMPKNKYRLALISFLTMQAIAWSTSLIVVQFGFISYPVRLFPKATRSSFVQLFIFFPMLYAWFILLFPQDSSWIKRFLHYFVFVSISAWFVYFVSIYANLEKFTKGSFTFQFIAIYIRYFFYFLIAKIYITWFLKKTNWSEEG